MFSPAPSSYIITDGNITFPVHYPYSVTDGNVYLLAPSSCIVTDGHCRLTRRSDSRRRNQTLRKEARERRTRYIPTYIDTNDM